MGTIPERILRLIETSGLSRRDFGGRVGLDESKLSKSLSGTRKFSSVDLARIAEFCHVTVDWLITGTEPPIAAAARTTGGNAGDALAAARRYTILRSDISTLGYPQPWRPVLDKPHSGTWAEQGRTLAHAAIKRIQAQGHRTSAEDLPTTIETVFGVDVATLELGAGIDGLAATAHDAKLIILATSHNPPRQRFTLAHELCHLLAGDDQSVHLDRDVYDRAQSKDPTEMRANSFASTFLMPEEILRDAVGDVRLPEARFAELACELLVTPAALAFRLKDLRLIDGGTCDRFRALSAKRAASLAGRAEVLASRVAESSRTRAPGLLLRDTYAAYDSGVATLRPYANLLGVDMDELRHSLEAGHETPDAL